MMKSTYFLLSIYLDGVPLPKVPPDVLILNTVVNMWDIQEDPNLFDYPVCMRKVSGNQLLSLTSARELEHLLDKLKDCVAITVTMDYKSKSVAARHLYVKRVLQAITLLSVRYSSITFQLAADDTTLKGDLITLYKKLS